MISKLKPNEEKFMQSLEWYVLRHDFNSNMIKHWNIFNSAYVYDRLPNLLNNFITYDKFKKEMQSLLMNHFWCRAEYEILCSGLFRNGDTDYQKLDVWYQIEPNLDILCHYIIDKWNNRPYARSGKDLEDGITNKENE